MTQAENRLRLPANGWKPREYQKPAWWYWVRDNGKLLELMWPRRAGKDAVALHGTCIKAHQRVANYWHMLPLANQVRKAIWEAVNPHTGLRRIDEAFPQELRESTREQEMMIRFRNGSTWQCLGSDNFQSAIGSTPAGIVYSEWSQTNPSASGYLRPILAENNGWEVKITTPRGKNHAYRSFNSAKSNPNAFAELLTIEDTQTLTPQQVIEERQTYIDIYGYDMGVALFEQEYYCSFEAAILGAVWGREFKQLEDEGRFTTVPHDPRYPVYTVKDIGFSDYTSIWFYQVIDNQVRIIDFEMDNQKGIDHYVSVMLGKRVSIDHIDGKLQVSYKEDLPEYKHRKSYDYERVWLPHDARAKTFASGKSAQEQFAAVFGWDKVFIVPSLSVQDGIQATRQMLKTCLFDKSTSTGFEACKQYRYEWDDKRDTFKRLPVHDWTSHPSDALRYLAIAWKAKPKPVSETPKPDKTQFIAGVELAPVRKANKRVW